MIRVSPRWAAAALALPLALAACGGGGGDDGGGGAASSESVKSLRVLDKKLRYLSEYADFHVNINSVIGGGIKNPDDALTLVTPGATQPARRLPAAQYTAR